MRHWVNVWAMINARRATRARQKKPCPVCGEDAPLMTGTLDRYGHCGATFKIDPDGVAYDFKADTRGFGPLE